MNHPVRKKILIIQQKMIGDVLISTFLCELIKKTHPNHIVDYLINEHTYPVVKGNPYIDHIICIKKEDEKNFFSLRRFTREKITNQYDVIIDVYSKISSNIIVFFSKAYIKVTYKKWYTKWIYSDVVSTESYNQNGALKGRLCLLKPVFDDDFSITNPKIYLTDAEKNKGKLFLTRQGVKPDEDIYMIGVLGSGLHKTYPLSYMAKVIDMIAKQVTGRFLFNYIPSQAPLVKKVYDLCQAETQERILWDAYTESLRDFLCVLTHCKALIGNEGGAVNMAKALEVPTFSIYSPQIKKAAWNTFSDKRNVAVHVLDYVSNEKDLREQELYQKFVPSLFKNELVTFLSNL